MRRASLLLGSLLGLGVLTGCADVGYGRSEPTYSSVASHELVAASYRAADALLAQFPQARAHVIAGAGHWVHAEKPDAVLRAIRRYLADIEN